MRPNTRRDLQQIMRGIKNGKLDPIEVAYLLIKLRYEKPQNSRFKDISDFVAHDTRDRYLSHKTATSYFDRVLQLMTTPASVTDIGTLARGQVFISQDEFLTALNARLNTIGLSEIDISRFGHLIMCNVLDALEGAEFQLMDDAKKKLAALELSEVVPDDQNRRTLYIKFIAKSPPFDREAASRGDWQILTMSQGAAIGFPFLQAVPYGVKPHIDAYVF